MQGSNIDRSIRDVVVIHPLDPEDAAITTAMRAMANSTKGARRGIEARRQFDDFMESVLPRDDVTFETDTLGGVPGLWVYPAKGGSTSAGCRRCVPHRAAEAAQESTKLQLRSAGRADCRRD